MNVQQFQTQVEEMRRELKVILEVDFDISESCFQRLEEGTREMASSFSQVGIVKIMEIQLYFARQGFSPTAIMAHTASAVNNICLHAFSVEFAEHLEIAKWQTAQTGG